MFCKRYPLPKAIAIVIFIFFVCVPYFSLDTKPNTYWKWKLFICLKHDTARIQCTLHTVHPISIIQTKNIEAWNDEMGKQNGQHYNSRGVVAMRNSATDRDKNNIHLFDLIHGIQNTWNACWLPYICIFNVWTGNWNILANREHQSYQIGCSILCERWTKQPTFQCFTWEKCSKFRICHNWIQNENPVFEIYEDTCTVHYSPCSNNFGAEKRDEKLNTISVYVPILYVCRIE